MKNSLVLVILMFCFVNIYSQTAIEKCKISKSYYDGIYSVTAEDVKCLAKNSEQPNMILFTFASWCVPCIYHLPNFFLIKKYYKVDHYVLLVDKENHRFTEEARNMVLETFPDAKILVIKDLEKGGKSKKYKDFLKNITPSKFQNIDDMSKYIVLNQKGEVQLVTNWNDSKDDPDLKDDKPMVIRLVIPLLQKRKSE